MSKIDTSDFNNPSNYKNCALKSYEAYVCLPPYGTVVINQLKCAQIIHALGGEALLTPDLLEELGNKNQQLLQQLNGLVHSNQDGISMVSGVKPVVVCGTMGEYYTVSANEFNQRFSVVIGNTVTTLSVLCQSGKINHYNNQYISSWLRIKSKSNGSSDRVACFVPLSKKFQIVQQGVVVVGNIQGVKHGKGDFVVCQKLPNGQPNFATRQIVNGNVFASTYNNQGWTDCIDLKQIPVITIDKLPKIETDVVDELDPKVFNAVCVAMMKALSDLYYLPLEDSTPLGNGIFKVDKSSNRACIEYRIKKHAVPHTVPAVGGKFKDESITIQFICDNIYDAAIQMVAWTSSSNERKSLWLGKEHVYKDNHDRYRYKDGDMCKLDSFTEASEVLVSRKFDLVFKLLSWEYPLLIGIWKYIVDKTGIERLKYDRNDRILQDFKSHYGLSFVYENGNYTWTFHNMLSDTGVSNQHEVIASCKGVEEAREKFIELMDIAVGNNGSKLKKLYDIILSRNARFTEPFIPKTTIMHNEGAGTLFLRFSTTTDPKYTFEVKYDSSKKSYVCYSNKELRFTVTGAEHAANYLIELLHKSYKGVRTEFRTPYLNQTAKDALIWYTADGFNDTTETLRDKASGGSVSFGQWADCIIIHSFLKKCQYYGNHALFRGVDHEVHEGDILEYPNFMSTSFDLDDAESFARGTGAVLRIRNTKCISAFYVDRISTFRNQENEVLLDSGYAIRVISLLYTTLDGVKVYDCVLKRMDKNVFDINYASSDMAFSLRNSLYDRCMNSAEVSSKCVVDHFKDDCTKYLRLIFYNSTSRDVGHGKDAITIHFTKEKVDMHIREGIKDKVKSFDILEEGVEEVIFLEIMSVCKEYQDTYSDYLTVYNTVSQKFVDEGFIIISDALFTDDENAGDLSKDSFKLCLTGDNDDKITVYFQLKKSSEDIISIRVRSRSQGVSLDKTAKYTGVQALADGLYGLITHTFKLNVYNRCDKVANLISRYMGVDYKVKDVTEGERLYEIGQYTLSAILQELKIAYFWYQADNDDIVECNHFDNIVSVATRVYNTLKGEDV